MKKYFFIFFIICASPAFAEECDLSKIQPGKKFTDIIGKYNISPLNGDENDATRNLHGQDICEILDGAEVSTQFVEKTLVRVEIVKRSDTPEILNLATKNYGPAIRKLNPLTTSSSYSTFWDNDNIAVSYSYKYFDDEKKYAEALIIQKKKYTDPTGE